MFGFFSSAKKTVEAARASVEASGLDGLWPKKAILDLMERRYGEITHIGDEPGFSLYGVADRGVRFVAAFVLADGAPEMTVEVGFLARFSGYEISEQKLEAINRNLHISMTARDTDGDLYVIGGVQASGVYSDDMFALVLDAWRRDLMVALQGFGGGDLIETFPAARFEAARAFARNAVPTLQDIDGRQRDAADDASGKESPARAHLTPNEPTQNGGQAGVQQAGAQNGAAQMLAAFLKPAGASLATCPECGGRGLVGFVPRVCATCGGSGFVRLKSRRTD